MYYQIEHWLMIIGIFGAGMLSMLGILIGADMHRKTRKPRTPMVLGFDPRNPINRRSVLNTQEDKTESGWYEIRPGSWM